MEHWRSELIDDPQWVSCCVEKGCSFEDAGYVRGRYVCHLHCSEHSCSGLNCALIRAMASNVPYCTSSESLCPVTELLTFRAEELEFQGPYYAGTHSVASYGALECEPDQSQGDRCHLEEEVNVMELVLKSSLSATIALFSTILSKEFIEQYKKTEDAGVALRSKPWMGRIFRLADKIRSGVRSARLNLARENEISIVKEAALKSAVAMSTLFSSRKARIRRFVKKMQYKHNDKQAKRADFYTMVIMVTLCFFPYLKHLNLGKRFNNRTLVLMCFDKTRTSHNQWSKLATQVHLHVNQSEFTKTLAKSELSGALSPVVKVTLDQCISLLTSNEEATGMENKSHRDTPTGISCKNGDSRELVPETSLGEEYTEPERAPLSSGRKRKKPCSSRYFDSYSERMENKVMRM